MSPAPDAAHADIIVLAVVAAILLIAFFVWEYYVTRRATRPPLMRLGLWTRGKGKLASMYFTGFVGWMGFQVGCRTRSRSPQALSYHNSLFYQQVQMTGVIGAMLRFLPSPVSGIICNYIVAKVISKVPTQWLVCIGLACTG